MMSMSILCNIFGHSQSQKGKHIPGYTISFTLRSVIVRVCDVCRCKRCGEIIVSTIEYSEKYCASPARVSEKEEEALRKKGIVPLADAYRMIIGDIEGKG